VNKRKVAGSRQWKTARHSLIDTPGDKKVFDVKTGQQSDARAAPMGNENECATDFPSEKYKKTDSQRDTLELDWKRSQSRRKLFSRSLNR
jgi:hypothetical protein